MATVVRALLGSTWLAIVATKAFRSCDLLATLVQVAGHEGPLRTIAVLVVLVESAAAWLLLAGHARAGGTLGALLVLAFTAITIAAGEPRALERCGCFPVAPSTAGGHLLVNGVLLASHGILLLWPREVHGRGRPDGSPRTTTVPSVIGESAWPRRAASATCSEDGGSDRTCREPGSPHGKSP